MRKYSIGDRVRYVRPGSSAHGAICTVIGIEPHALVVDMMTGANKWESGYAIDLPFDEKKYSGVFAAPENLEPYYDGNDKVTWSALAEIWQPKRIGA